jgi:HEAT repeat protein
MFGSNENEMQHLVKKHQWDKIGKKLVNADVQTKVDCAAACGCSADETASEFLINLLKDGNESVQLQAVESLGEVGREHTKTHLQWLLGSLPDGKDAIKKAIQDSIIKINKRK